MTSFTARCVGGPFNGRTLRVNAQAPPPRSVTWAPLDNEWGILPITYEWFQPRDEDDEAVGEAIWRFVPEAQQ